MYTHFEVSSNLINKSDTCMYTKKRLDVNKISEVLLLALSLAIEALSISIEFLRYDDLKLSAPAGDVSRLLKRSRSECNVSRAHVYVLQ